MTSDRKLILGISVGLTVKILLLAVLWTLFVKDHRPPVNASRMESLFFPHQ